MRVLVCGADGFLGQAISGGLVAVGHTVLRGVRRPSQPGDLAMDYRQDLTVGDWLPRLAGVEAVVNAVGILRERRPGDYARIHHQAPAALFCACAQAGVRRVVQISALGRVATPYLESKHAADGVLLQHVPQGVVLRPSLIFGEQGASTRFFLALASLPFHAIPRDCGDVQPVHRDDVVAAVLKLLEGATPPGRILELAGPRRLGYGEWLAGYRSSLGLAPALGLPVPASLMTLTARLAGLFPGSLLCPDTWAMLRAGNTADPEPARALLGRPLRPPEGFLGQAEQEPARLGALGAWRTPLLRGVLASIWLASAALSLGIHPLPATLDLLAPFGLEGNLALAVLLGAAGLDLAMGLATLFRPGKRLWLAQMALIVVYSLLVAWQLPEFLTHPFAPILKNLAILALLVQLWAEER